MTQEEKAKRYDEALERARKLKENPKAIFFEEKNVHVSDYIFPELKESEDEKIRKELLESFKYQQRESRMDKEWLNGIKLSEVVAWLEKQGEQILANSTKTCKNEEKLFDYESVQQKDFALKVEPKFHEGEWITIKE